VVLAPRAAMLQQLGAAQTIARRCRAPRDPSRGAALTSARLHRWRRSSSRAPSTQN